MRLFVESSGDEKLKMSCLSGDKVSGIYAISTSG